MKYKMIVSDFDGTIYRDDYTISKECIDAIEDYKKAGGLFFIATGRLYQAIKPHTKLFNLVNEVITYQGGGVYDLTSDKMVLSYSINDDLASDIYKNVMEQYPDTTMPMMFYNDLCYTAFENKPVSDFASIVKVSVNYTKVPISEYIEKNKISPNKILFLVEPKHGEEVVSFLKEKYGDKINVNRSNIVLIEIVSKDASKGNAVKWLANKYNINREEIICIGDAENDNSMIEYAGLGVAMGNAMDTTKRVADFITDTNNNDGVAKVIREIALKE